MRKYLLSFFCIAQLCWGQTSTNSYHDDFGAKSIWPDLEDEEGSGKAIKGKYVLKSKMEDAEPISSISPYIDWKKDFSIEMTYTQKTFHAHNISGLIWAKDDRTYNGFFIRMNGFFQVVKVVNDNIEKTVQDWTKVDMIRTANHSNTLEVSKDGSEFVFYINGKEVYKSPVSNFNTHFLGMGFMVEGNNTIEVDDFKFDQNVKINVSADALIEKKKQNLGTNINTKYNDLNPIISADGKTLYYAIDGHPSNIGGTAQDIWYSTKVSDTVWNKSKNIGLPLNNIEHNGVISVSPDNNTVYLSGTYKKSGKASGGGFSYSNRTSDGWSVPKDIKIKDFYNQSQYQEACIGPNKKTLIFTANRADTKGDNDMYVSFLEGDDQWSIPINMGNINTDEDEASPFLAADGKTLYFSSNGRAGYGDMDVFVSKRLDNSWTKWSEPLNMGPYINTISFDAYFSVPAKGDYAYLVTTADSQGEEDVVRVTLSDASRPEPVVVIHGKILDAKTKKPLSADLTYEELPEGKDLGNAISNPSTGEYKLVLPYEKVYGIFAEKTGYLTKNDNIDLTKIHEYAEIEKDFYLVPIEIGEKIVMNNIFFAVGTPNILPSSNPELDRFVDMLKKNPKMEIEIGGHTDNVGEPALNQILSEQRVMAITKYFTSKGILPKRMTGKGYGDSQPIASNLKEETRKLNRRVEIKIMKK